MLPPGPHRPPEAARPPWGVRRGLEESLEVGVAEVDHGAAIPCVARGVDQAYEGLEADAARPESLDGLQLGGGQLAIAVGIQ